MPAAAAAAPSLVAGAAGPTISSGGASPTHSESSVDSGIGSISGSSSGGSGGSGGSGVPQNVAAIKAQCFKEIRQPGRKYEKLLGMIASVEHVGGRQKLVKDLIAECKRYRK